MPGFWQEWLGECYARTDQDVRRRADWVAVGGYSVLLWMCLLILRYFKDIWLEPSNRLVKIMGLALKGDIRFKNIVLRISKIKVLVKTIRVNCITKLTT